MEERKAKEIEYYDKQGKKLLADSNRASTPFQSDFERFNQNYVSSYKFLYDFLKNKCAQKLILDYGCGNGNHAVSLAKWGGKVIAIDLSESLLEVARKNAQRFGIDKEIEFIKMDCEKLEFPDDSFDIIFDGGTFSSLDLEKALPELARVLRPGGFLVGIETLGHNPFANLKRKFNVITGKRTEWAASHIFNEAALKKAKEYFGEVQTKHFHLFSWVLFGLLSNKIGVRLLSIIEPIDQIFMRMPFFNKYGFKVVFKFSDPKNNKKSN